MHLLAALFASAISPFFLEVTPEVRSTYVSIGKIMEDRPMQITGVRFGADAGAFGRFGIRNWDVSSLTDRRHDVHRHALYHTEFGPTWQYDLDIADGGRWSSGVSSVTFRLEVGWRLDEHLTAFAFAEQYEVTGQATRHAVSASSSRCAHNDWTLGGIGMRISF